MDPLFRDVESKRTRKKKSARAVAFPLVEAGGDMGDTSAPALAKSPQHLTVSELSGRIKLALQSGLPAKVRVVGEISNLSNRTHWFFSLKDEGATIRCVCFASNARKVNFKVSDGMQVVATGRVDYYDAQGSVQLYVDAIEPVGVGALELQLRQLCEELRGLGYFDPARKKPLPLVPRRVAVVTSRTGAALQDVINTTSRRWPGCELRLIDVLVQGAAAAPKIAHAIDTLSRDGARHGIDVVLLTRGGGSLEDLWAFNERIVADAIFRCRLPIVAAIGHEVDTTVAELVADRRCATPTQAAMEIVPDARDLQRQVLHLSQRLAVALKRQAERERQRLSQATRSLQACMPRRLAECRQRLASVSRSAVLRQPEVLVSEAQKRLELAGQRLAHAFPRRCASEARELDRLSQRLTVTLPRRITAVREAVESRARELEAVGPQNVLSRGYSYTLTQDGRVLRSASEVTSGNLIRTMLADGTLLSRVEQEAEGDASQPDPRRKPSTTDAAKSALANERATVAKPRRGSKKRDEDGPTLFGS